MTTPESKNGGNSTPRDASARPAECVLSWRRRQFDRHRVGDDVEDRGAIARLLDDLLQLLRGRIATNRKAHADRLKAVAHRVTQTEHALQINLAFDLAVTSVRSTPRCRDARDARDQTRAECVEHQLHRRRPVIFADQHRRVIGVDVRRLHVDVLAAGAEEAVDRRARVSALLPARGCAELELRRHWLLRDRVQCREHAGRIDAVARLRGGLGGASGGRNSCGHDSGLLSMRAASREENLGAWGV